MEKERESLWINTTRSTSYPSLEKNISVDIAIIGGGIAGLMTAYFLEKDGYRIAILEANKIAEGTSGNTTAKITSLHSLKYSYLMKNFKINEAKKYADSNQWAIKEFETIINQEKIGCDFQRIPAYVYAQTQEGLAKINEEITAAKKLGLPASFVSQDESIPFPIKGEIKFDNQAYFHPRKFLLSIAEILAKKDVLIFENSRIVDIKEKEFYHLNANGFEIKARSIVVATDYPIYDKGFFFMRMNQMRSYAVASRASEFLPSGMYVGIDGNMISFRPHVSKGQTWTIISGEAHPTGDVEGNYNPFEKLEKIAKKKFGLSKIDLKWAAQDSMPADLVPFIGKMPRTKNAFVATGFGEWGMTTSIVSAKILSDLIASRENAWASIYSPSRIKPVSSLRRVGSFVSHAAKGYAARIKENEKIDFEKIPLGEGKILEYEDKKIAAYKNKDGSINALSPICTHMGCIVRWNGAEKSWDCPCHGSRFGTNGNILNSPAIKPLGKMKNSKK